jgi:hypothetical protein
MSAAGDTLPAPSADAEAGRDDAPIERSLEAILLGGLTAHGDDTPALSLLSDTHAELEALVGLLSRDLDGEPLERARMVILFDGIERRFAAGVELLRRELAGAKGAR